MSSPSAPTYDALVLSPDACKEPPPEHQPPENTTHPDQPENTQTRKTSDDGEKQKKKQARGGDLDWVRTPPLSLVSEIARFLGSAMGIGIADRKNRCDFGASAF